MPRIRKRTSRRGTTNQREKIKHKVSETRKKRKKESKKNPQWKSKHKQDPGIPNAFPYKDQILAEVAERKRQAEEAKQLKKEQKKAAKVGALEEHDVEDAASEGEGSDVGGLDGVSTIRAAGSSKQTTAAEVEKMDVDDESPVLESKLGSLQEVLEEADVVVEVLDARDPLAYHSEHLANLVRAKEGQKLLLVLNKIDASPKEAVSAWSAHLRSQHPTLFFRSASAFLPAIEPVQLKGKGKARADDAVGVDSILSLLGQWAQEKTTDEPLAVAVVGFTNAGKTSFIDSLLRKAALPIYQLSAANDGPTTTICAQEVTLEVASKTIRLIDTPGYSWVVAGAAEATRARDILTRSKGRIERLKDPEPVVHEIVSRTGQEDLMLFYNLPAFADGDTDAFLRALARTSGLVKKGGVLDTAGASRIILRDWSTGKLPRYTIPASTASETAHEPSLRKVYAADEEILSTLQTRKELRAGPGLVKLKPSETEARQLALGTTWVNSEEGEESEDADVDNDENKVENDDEDWEDSEASEDSGPDQEDVDDSEPEPPASKRKRGTATDTMLTSRPIKKVAFTTEPKNTKQARKVAGARGSLSTKAKPEPVKSSQKPKAAKAQSSPKVVQPKKAANAPSNKSAAPANASGGEAYDFKMFF